MENKKETPNTLTHSLEGSNEQGTKTPATLLQSQNGGSNTNNGSNKSDK